MDVRSRTLVLVLGAASLLDSAAIVTVATVLPVWREQHDLTDWQVGALSATLTSGIALGALVGGRLADSRGRGTVFTATVAAYAGAAAVLAVAPTFPVLLVALAVLGLSIGADLPASLALLADHAVHAALGARARAVASTHVLWTTGIVVATAAGFAVSSRPVAGTRVLFALLAVGAVATLVGRRSSAVVAAAARADRRRAAAALAQGRATGRGSWRSLTQDRQALRSLALLGGFYVAYILVSNTFGSFRPYVLVVVGGATQSTATAVSFGLSVVGLVGTVVFSRVVGTRHRSRAYVAGSVGVVVAQLALAAALGTSFAGVVLALLLHALSFPYAGEGLFKVWTQELLPADHRATALGLTTAVARAAAAAFALVTPTLLDASPRGVFVLLACLAATSAVLGWRVARVPG